jgi:hypothetical protein
LIWEVTEGALTDKPPTQIIWVCFGNPTRNKGRFRECFKGGKFAHRWKTATIDSRTVSFTNKEQFERWVEDYGEDHDFVRVRVRGIFPRVDAESFIPLDLAREACIREIDPPLGMPVVLGVDIGRFGDDPSVIYARKGRDARTIPPEIYFNLDTMAMASKIMVAMQKHHATMAFVDEGGVGGGVIDRLRQLRVPGVYGVNFSTKPFGINVESGIKYANRRAEIWGALRDFLTSGIIEDKLPGLEHDLVDEIIGPTFTLNNKEEILLESKKELRKRGIPSPNVADALALTFSLPEYVPERDRRQYQEFKAEQTPDYNPYEPERMGL